MTLAPRAARVPGNIRACHHGAPGLYTYGCLGMGGLTLRCFCDSGGYYTDYLQSRSTDTGRTWSKPSFMLGAGSADPQLLRVGGSVVLSGGRNCNEINKTVHGVKRGADLMLWLNDDGMAEHWTMYSLSYWHNALWMNASMVDWHNCTRRGPNCFSPGLNTSCRTETSAYTSLHIDGNAENAGWVKYDMHGIPFAMRFVLETQTKTDTRTVPAVPHAQHALRGAAAAVAPAAPGPGAAVGPVVHARRMQSPGSTTIRNDSDFSSLKA